ncbi:MAG: hypothetical protein KIT86_07070 [Hydrogenophaga sp.]|uniref:hypothetical protein n=1 Tax=Hydrogenophaga sp. TaxID=1904254 RepID=UPI0026158167|nr:hypothetical protein [Hydrogenophaga sp.]MCW5669406.1 hypothetical protein [Hydrogenophaga sp.]
MVSNGGHIPTLSVGTIAYVSPFYFITVGLLYLWAYWGTFHVNILEHAGLSDVVRAAAQPIASTFVFWIVGSLFGHWLSTGEETPGVDAKAHRASRTPSRVRYTVYTFALAFIGAGVFFTSPAILWILLPMAAVAIATRVLPSSWAREIVPSEGPRRLLVGIFVALPLFAFAQGKFRADMVKSGREFTYLQSIWPGVKDELTTTDVSPRLLGRAGSSLFFFLPASGGIAVTSVNVESSYHLNHFKLDVTPWQRLKAAIKDFDASAVFGA